METALYDNLQYELINIFIRKTCDQDLQSRNYVLMA